MQRLSCGGVAQIWLCVGATPASRSSRPKLHGLHTQLQSTWKDQQALILLCTGPGGQRARPCSSPAFVLEALSIFALLSCVPGHRVLLHTGTVCQLCLL